jgi:hypothetical protein
MSSCSETSNNSANEKSVRNTVQSTTKGKTRKTHSTLHESILILKQGLLSKNKKVFCVLLENDPHFYFTSFQNLDEEEPNFVNPYLNVIDANESVHNSFY